MRTFGTEADNLIDVELAYGMNDYNVAWFQNGLQRDIVVTKAVIHFVGAKSPSGNVTKDYLELNTEYLNYLEEDAIRVDITEDDSTLTVGTYYVAGFTKNEYDAFYTAYSSLINLGLKLDAWSNAPESASIKDIVHHFIDPLDTVFDAEPSSTLTFNASMTDFSSLTLGELLGYCACIENCNYVLRGNVLYKVVPAADITKEYNIDDVVYSENLSQITSDTTLDYIKVNYKTVSQETDEEGQVSYDFNDASYICKTGTETCGFELNIGLIPTSESAFQSHFNTYFNSIKGMDCNGYNISFLGDARVEVGDKLKFSNTDNSAVLNVSELTWEWDGGLKCTVSSGSELSSSSESSFSIQQVVSQIQAMTNAVKNVQYNAVYANELYVKTAELGFASIKQLSAEIAKMGLMTADQADIKYAKIDMSNIEKATIGTVLANIGLISNATIVNGHVTGYLDSVGVNADDITAGTLAVDRLVIRGSEKSIVYELNNITGALQAASVDTLNGEIITPRTINADKIVANSITATELAVGSVTAEKILGYSITADKLNVTDLSAISANLGTVTAGIIQSTNYVENTIGMKLDLNLGEWDSKHLKIESDGSIEASNLKMRGGNIDIVTDDFNYDNHICIGYEKLVETETESLFYIQSVTLLPSAIQVLYQDPDKSTNSVVQIGNLGDVSDIGDVTVYDAKGIGLYSGSHRIGLNVTTGNILVSGTVQADNWIRTTGNTGWYSESYGGGWYMADSEWVRTYNNKKIYCDNLIRADGGLNVYGIGNDGIGQMTFDYGGRRVIFRMDGSSFYILKGALGGSWDTDIFPLQIDMNVGKTTIGNLSINNALTCNACRDAKTTASPNCYIDTLGQFFRTSGSSKRFKYAIKPLEDGELDPSHLYDVQVVQYRLKEEYNTKDDCRYGKTILGLVAEDVYEKYPICSDYHIDKDGQVVCDDWNLRFVVPAMLKLIQNQKHQIDFLEKRVALIENNI